MTLGSSAIFTSNIGLTRLGSIAGSPVLRSTIVFSISGIIFAVSNLTLARLLPEMEYAIIALFIALFQVGSALGPGGLEVIVNRHKLKPSRPLLYLVLFVAFIIGSLMVVISSLIYQINIGILFILGFGIIAGSANRLVAAHYQSMQRFGVSLCVSEGPVMFLALAALAIMFLQSYNAWLPCGIVATGFAISATISWIKLAPSRQTDTETKLSIPWHETISIFGFNSALLIMLQFERLIVPKVLSLEVLATLAVLMTIAGAPFRMLQLGTIFTMLPRFKNADSAKELKRLLRNDSIVILCTAIGVGIAIWFIVPVIVGWFLSGKYIISQALVMAAIIVGFVKIVDAIVSTAVTALGSSNELSILTCLSWVAIGISALGAFIGGHWGLVGVIYGVGFGWFFRTLIASVLVGRFLYSRSE
jgi:O-antigen/teichoic acid export membrane protein